MDLSLRQLEQAVGLRRQIDSLQQRLASLVGRGGGGGRAASPAAAKAGGRRRRRRTMSAATRAKIAAAARRRWARVRGGKAKANIRDAISAVSRMLGNTPAICRKCYVHPAVLETYLDGELIEGLKERAEETLTQNLDDLRSDEIAVLTFLRQRLEKKTASTKRAAQ